LTCFFLPLANGSSTLFFRTRLKQTTTAVTAVRLKKILKRGQVLVCCVMLVRSFREKP